MDYAENLDDEGRLILCFTVLENYEETKQPYMPSGEEEEQPFVLGRHKQTKQIENPWIDQAIHGEYLERKKVSNVFTNQVIGSTS